MASHSILVLHLEEETPAEVSELDLKNGKRSRRPVHDLVALLAFEADLRIR
jgi:hypothetical protein